MNERYIKQAAIFKALSDPNRLMIVDMLSCGEMCACKILEKFRITQPTLSHHMKTLCECGLVNTRREGKWCHYALNEAVVRDFCAEICALVSEKQDCICREGGCGCDGDE